MDYKLPRIFKNRTWLDSEGWRGQTFEKKNPEFIEECSLRNVNKFYLCGASPKNFDNVWRCRLRKVILKLIQPRFSFSFHENWLIIEMVASGCFRKIQVEWRNSEKWIELWSAMNLKSFLLLHSLVSLVGGVESVRWL